MLFKDNHLDKVPSALMKKKSKKNILKCFCRYLNLAHLNI